MSRRESVSSIAKVGVVPDSPVVNPVLDCDHVRAASVDFQIPANSLAAYSTFGLLGSTMTVVILPVCSDPPAVSPNRLSGETSVAEKSSGADRPAFRGTSLRMTIPSIAKAQINRLLVIGYTSTQFASVSSACVAGFPQQAPRARKFRPTPGF
jgi:hypothetical protein